MEEVDRVDSQLTWHPAEEGSQPAQPSSYYVPSSLEAVKQCLTFRRSPLRDVASRSSEEDTDVDEGRQVDEHGFPVAYGK